jgi:ABC-2 type transport system ATP-binding protein
MTWGLHDVRVSRGGSIALDGVTLPAGPAAITIVLGGDGAGKSTCLEMLVGLLEPAAGTVGRPVKEHIGYVPATAGLFADLTVQENLDFIAGAYRLPGRERSRKTAEILERTGLAGARDRLGGHLSGGMQRKLAVGMALLHSPGLLVLDEPTTGVDPVSRMELWRLIAGAAASGTAVVASTTYLNEAVRAAHAVLLEAGKVLASGPPEDVERSVAALAGEPGR